MTDSLLKPDYIFESSWEVCNKVGGIYTVLSTRAKTLQEAHPDQVIFIGPGLWKREDGNYTKEESPYFREDSALFAEWQWEAKQNGLTVRVGRNCSRWRSVNCLLSLIRSLWKSGGKMTAAAVTGPARHPRPASSQPASTRPAIRYCCNTFSDLKISEYRPHAKALSR